jgi:hypothetical protein
MVWVVGLGAALHNQRLRQNVCGFWLGVQPVAVKVMFARAFWWWACTTAV